VFIFQLFKKDEGKRAQHRKNPFWDGIPVMRGDEKAPLLRLAISLSQRGHVESLIEYSFRQEA
jgi:uncharacterized membrane protein